MGKGAPHPTDGRQRLLAVTPLRLRWIKDHRAAHDPGYHVTLAVDAMVDRSDESHQHSIAKVFPRQDWLVLTQLTHDNASAEGVVMALQFGPQLVLLPWAGYTADHFDRRKLLFATQGMLGLLALVGTFGLNFPIFISSMAVKALHAGAGRYGLLTSAMAIGSVTGALLSARRAKPYFDLLAGAAGVFGAGLCVAALVPDYGLFDVALAVIGVAAQTFTTSTNSYMQLTSAPQMRGRVVAVFLAVAMGGTPIGAPLVGWVADTLGPHWAMGLAGATCMLAAAAGLRHLVRHGRWRIRVDARRLRVTVVTDPVSKA